MSNTPLTSGRLDSLKGKKSGTTSAKPGAALKFKPKVVARRTKEERDADAPIMISESSLPPPRHNNTRGRGSTRGRGRGGFDRNSGTHIISSGPLSSGFVSMESKKPASRSGFSPSPTPEFIKNLRVRNKLDSLSTSGSSTLSLASDDDDDFSADGDTKINMSLEYQFDDSQTELFPVRAIRNVHKDYGELLVVSSTPEPELDPNSKLDNELSKSVSVKSEPEEMSVIPEETHTKAPSVDPIGDDQVLEERHRLAADYAKIHSLMHLFRNKLTVTTATPDSEGDINMDTRSETLTNDVEGKDFGSEFLFFQLPRTLPQFHSSKANEAKEIKESEQLKVKEEDTDDTDMKIDNDDEVEIKMETHVPKGTKFEKGEKLNGQVGTLRYHKSGKVTMKLGNIIFDVSRGGNIGFLQDVVYIKDQVSPVQKEGQEITEENEEVDDEEIEEEPEIYHLGQILEKIVAAPRIDI